MLWVKLVSGAVQEIIAKMNFTLFITALHKCILAHVVMNKQAKWTYLRPITLLFKTNLVFLEEAQPQEIPAQHWRQVTLLS